MAERFKKLVRPIPYIYIYVKTVLQLCTSRKSRSNIRSLIFHAIVLVLFQFHELSSFFMNHRVDSANFNRVALFRIKGVKNSSIGQNKFKSKFVKKTKSHWWLHEPL